MRFALYLVLGLVICTDPITAQVLTVRSGLPSQEPTPIVQHGESWRYRRGTNEPQADWRVTGDANLDTTWLTGNGGFGYGDAGIQGEATTISNMRNVHSTLYLRREFTVPGNVEATADLRLLIDYDDAFVAYLDGVELTRRNLAGAPDSPVLFNALAIAPHEASCCTAPVNAPTTIGLGPVGSRLSAGTHVLAIIAINDDTNSSDLHLIADLSIVPPATDGVVNNGDYALTTNSAIYISGTNTVAGSTRVTVNGEEAAYNVAQSTWSFTAELKPGWNLLYVAALDSSGAILTNVVRNVVFQTSLQTLGGSMTSSLLVSNRGAVLQITNNVVVPAGITLEVADGAVVLVNSGVSVVAQNGGRIDVHGTFSDKVFFNVSGQSSTNWGPLSAVGTNSSISVVFADVAHAQVSARDGAIGLIQDSTLHDFDPGSGAAILVRPIVMCNFASLFQVRRVHVRNYYECLVRNGIIEIEDSLFEQVLGDAVDFDSAQPGSYTRRCTYRDGTRGNVDAVDIGPADLPGSTDTLIADCIMLNFPFDKGVSVGDGGSSHGIVVSNCVIYGCNAGVMAKDLCDVSVRNCTIVNNTSGFTNYNKANPASPTGGGIITNSYNNILWNNVTTIGMANDGQLFADHNDFGNTNWPGAGNIDIDPLFVDAVRNDFRLQTNSPARGAGRDGADMGATYPVGGIPVQPLRLAAVGSSNGPVLLWVDDSQNEDGVVVQRSTNTLNWHTVATLAGQATNFTDTTAELGRKYYYRVQHTNYVGVSPFSNVASETGTAAPAVPEIRLHIQAEPVVWLWFVAESNIAYTVEFKNSLTEGEWQTLTNIGSGERREVRLTNDASASTRFFRATVD